MKQIDKAVYNGIKEVHTSIEELNYDVKNKKDKPIKALKEASYEGCELNR